MQVAKLALPMFLQRCRGMLNSFAEDIRRQQEQQGGRMELDEFMCMLEVLQLMQLAPAVADAVIPSGSSLQVGLAHFIVNHWAVCVMLEHRLPALRCGLDMNLQSSMWCCAMFFGSYDARS